MPRQKLPPRLWLRPAEYDRQGRLVSHPRWIILDGKRQVSTGCSEGDVEGAALALEAHIKASYRPSTRERQIEAVPIADCLILYKLANEDHQPSPEGKKKWEARLSRLNEFWGGLKLSEVTEEKCAEYVKQRGAGGARRDLEDLRAAIIYHARKGLHRGVVIVTLPPKGEARQDWLRRDQAAALIRICRRTKEMQRRNRHNKRAAKLPTAKYPLRHLARFVLIGLYTGTRAASIAAASPYKVEGRSYVDLDAGIFYRRAIGRRATNKRQPPVRLPERLLAHMRRWWAMEMKKPEAERAQCFVEFNGKPVKSVKTAMKSAVALTNKAIERKAKKAGAKASLIVATPHTLRHTAATWLMLNGAPTYDAAHLLGMSEKVLRDTYGHHHPDYQVEVGQTLANGHRRRQSLRQSLRVV